jgi:hypothetical protein
MPTQGLMTYFDNAASVTIRPLIQTAGRPIEDLMAEVKRAIDPTTL